MQQMECAFDVPRRGSGKPQRAFWLYPVYSLAQKGERNGTVVIPYRAVIRGAVIGTTFPSVAPLPLLKRFCNAGTNR